MTGPDVAAFHAALRQLGFALDEVAEERFGSMIRETVAAFQPMRGLKHALMRTVRY